MVAIVVTNGGWKGNIFRMIEATTVFLPFLAVRLAHRKTAYAVIPNLVYIVK